MPARALPREAVALFGYLAVALTFSWPLPLHLADVLLGTGDTPVYVWNLWVFRHEIVDHHRLPFLTNSILALSQPVPLALHNYTTFANLLAFPLLPILGLVRTFNLLILASQAMTAYLMYWYARIRTGDSAAAWLAGLLFGFSPYMTARSSEHFSLILAAPLPLFAWQLYRVLTLGPSLGRACATGAIVAWAFLCEPYYAVYCLMLAMFFVAYTAVAVERRPVSASRGWWKAVLDLTILCVVGLIVGLVLRGGGRFAVFGIRISIMRLYTPMLVLTLLALLRVWLTLRPRLVSVPPLAVSIRVVVPACAVCIAILTPVLYAAGSPFGERQWIWPEILWQSSPPGVDLLAFFVPNPQHPWFGGMSRAWLAALPNGFVENVASIPLVALLTIGLSMRWAGFHPPGRVLVFTAFFALLALGPFVSIAGHFTYVPTPWALLRYLPVIGAARMPTRLTVIVLLGIALLTAMALQHLRSRVRRPGLLTAAFGAVLLFELLPAPRPVYSADVPSIYHIVAADPRPVRLMELPFGLRDGMSSAGNFSAYGQFYQTVHGKHLVGGYISRLPKRSVESYRRFPVLGALMQLSEGRPVEPGLLADAYASADRTLERLQIGYVVVDRTQAQDALVDLARAAFHLTLVASAQNLELYRTPLTPP